MPKETDQGEKWGGDFFGPHAWASIYSSRRQGGLKKWVLWLLSEHSLRGSEIIEAMAKQSMGWWRPSPGTIYPLLHQLEENKLISRQSDSRYVITQMGLEEIGLNLRGREGEDHSDFSMEGIISNLESYVDYLEDEKSNITSDYRVRLDKIKQRLEKL